MVALNSVNRKLTNNRISLFIVITCRPEFKLPARVAGNSNFNEIELECLPDGAIKEFINRLSDKISLTSEIQEKLLTSGRGNPLYITEWFNLQHEQKSSEIKPRSVVNLPDEAGDVMPQSLSTIISSRLRLQSDLAQNFLQILSLCGNNTSTDFAYAVAESKLGIGSEQLNDITNELCDFGWLIKVANQSDSVLKFSNRQNMEVCADSVNRQSRQIIHNTIAEIAEDFYAEETGKEEYIANNYEKAGNVEKALFYYLKADRVRMRHAIAHCILDVNLQLAITIFKEIAADADYLYQYSGRKIYQDIAIESKKYL